MTLSKSTYAALYEDSGEVYIKLSDDMDKIIFKNQYGMYFGTLFKSTFGNYTYGVMGADTYLRSSAVGTECTIYCVDHWEEPPIILEGKELTHNNVWFFKKNGSAAGLLEIAFVLDGRGDNSKRVSYGFNSYTTAMKKDSIAVDYLFEVSSTAH